MFGVVWIFSCCLLLVEVGGVCECRVGGGVCDVECEVWRCSCDIDVLLVCEWCVVWCLVKILLLGVGESGKFMFFK